MLRKLVFLSLMVAVIAASFVSPAAAKTSNASVYVVHGIPGKDLGLDPTLPVDVSVNGSCALPAFKFGDIAGPLSLPEGTYSIAISLANQAAPCSNEAVIAADVPFVAGENATVIAHLTDLFAPTATKFVNSLKPAHPGLPRLIIQHTAAAPVVDITLSRSVKNYPLTRSLSSVANGDQGMVDVLPGRWMASIAPAGSPDAVFGPAALNLRPFTTYLVYAVGSLDNGTFTLLTKPVRQPRWK